MDDFDRYLEARLRRLLDPVAARRPPVRERRLEQGAGVIALPQPAVGALAPEAIPVVDPVASLRPL